MRVLIVDPCERGGICHHTYNLCEALAKEGLDVLLVAARNYELRRLPHTFKIRQVFRLVDVSSPGKQPRVLFTVRARLNLCLDFLELLWVLVANRPDIVHFQWFRTLKPDRAYLGLLRHLGFRLVFTAHEVIPASVDPKEYDSYCRALYRQFAKIIVFNEQAKRSLCNKYEYPVRDVYVIPLGKYSFFCRSGSRDAGKVRNRMGFSATDKVILFFGRISQEKGLRFLIEALAIVKKTVPEARLLIAGEPQEDFSPYDELLTKLGLLEDVRRDLHYIPFQDVPDYFLVADIVALPYLRSTQSGVLELALALGRPVVASDVGNFRDVLPEETGCLVPPGEVNVLADRLSALLQDAPKRRRMGKAAEEALKTRPSWSSIAKQNRQVYEALLSRTQ